MPGKRVFDRIRDRHRPEPGRLEDPSATPVANSLPCKRIGLDHDSVKIGWFFVARALTWPEYELYFLPPEACFGWLVLSTVPFVVRAAQAVANGEPSNGDGFA